MKSFEKDEQIDRRQRVEDAAAAFDEAWRLEAFVDPRDRRLLVDVVSPLQVSISVCWQFCMRRQYLSWLQIEHK